MLFFNIELKLILLTKDDVDSYLDGIAVVIIIIMNITRVMVIRINRYTLIIDVNLFV